MEILRKEMVDLEFPVYCRWTKSGSPVDTLAGRNPAKHLELLQVIKNIQHMCVPKK